MVPPDKKEIVEGPWETIFPHIFTSLLLPRALGDLRDVVIIVEGVRYPAHKAILCAASPVLNTMLNSAMRESVDNEINLTTLNEDTWKGILGFMYHGAIQIRDQEKALEIVQFAHQYEMSILMKYAEAELKKGVSKFNAVRRLVLANELGLQGLREQAKTVIDKYFLWIYETDEFKNLPFVLLDEILGRENLKVISELDVFDAVFEWANYNCEMTGSSGASAPPWKFAEARYLLRNMDGSQMGVAELKTLTRFPNIRPFLEEIPYLLNNLSLEETNKIESSIRYSPDLRAKRSTFLYEIKFEEITESWSRYQVDSEGYCLQLRRREGYIETNLSSSIRKVKDCETFVLGRNRKSRAEIQKTCIGKNHQFDKRAWVEDEAIMFGANIFYE